MAFNPGKIMADIANAQAAFEASQQAQASEANKAETKLQGDHLVVLGQIIEAQNKYEAEKAAAKEEQGFTPADIKGPVNPQDSNQAARQGVGGAGLSPQQAASGGRAVQTGGVQSTGGGAPDTITTTQTREGMETHRLSDPVFGGFRRFPTRETVTTTQQNVLTANKQAELRQQQLKEQVEVQGEGLASLMFEVGRGNATEQEVEAHLTQMVSMFGPQATAQMFAAAQARAQTLRQETNTTMLLERAKGKRFGKPTTDAQGNLIQTEKQSGEVKILVPATNGAPTFKDILATTREFNSESTDFKTVRDAFRRIQSIGLIDGGESESAAGDLAFIFSFMKMLDPGSVVRESEFATAENAAGVPDRVKNLFNKAQHGLKLTPTQRVDFFTQSKAVFKATRKDQLLLEGEFEQFSVRNNIDPSRVILDHIGDLRSPTQSDVDRVEQELGTSDLKAISSELKRQGFNLELD